jgi:hypothetical protein
MRENGERIVLLCTLVAALTRAGRLAETAEAKEIVFSARNDNSQDHQDDLLYALVVELNWMGYHTEALETARAIKAEKRRVDAVVNLAAALCGLGDQRAHAVFTEAKELAHAIRNDRHRAEAKTIWPPR